MLTALCQRRSSVTFDLGSSGIRATQLRRRGDRIALCDALQYDVAPPNPADEISEPDSVIARAARVVDQGRFRGRDVAIMLSPPAVQLRMLRLPEQVLTQDEDRIQQALRWEVSRDTRLAPDSLEVRHWLLPPGHNQGLNVMATCMPHDQGRDWFVHCAQHHLNLKRIDVAPRAQVRLARRMWSAAPDDLWGILDLGFGQVNFTAVIGDVPTYVRCLSVSIDDWTRRLASGLDIPYAIADRLKCAYGILPGSRGVRDLSAGWQSLRAEDLPHVLFGLLRSAVDDLVRDILKCFTYVLNSFPNLNTTRVMLAGGGANLKGLSELLEAQLGLPVAVLALRGNKDSAGWEAPLTDLVFEPESATSVGGALLDLEDL